MPQAMVQAQLSPLTTNKPHSAHPHHQQAQLEILPELLDITWNPSVREANNQPASDLNPGYVYTQLYHQVQPMPHSTTKSYQTHSSVADNLGGSQVSTCSSLPAHAYQPAHEQQNLSPYPAAAMDWNIWACTPASQDNGHTDLLLGDAVNTASSIQNCENNEAILIASPNTIIADKNAFEPISIIDLTYPLAAQNIHSSSALPAPSPDNDLMAQFLRLSEPAPKVDSRPVASTVASEEELEKRFHRLVHGDAPKADQVHEQDVDAQLAARLKALGTIQGQNPKKARQLAHEHQ